MTPTEFELLAQRRRLGRRHLFANARLKGAGWSALVAASVACVTPSLTFLRRDRRAVAAVLGLPPGRYPWQTRTDEEASG